MPRSYSPRKFASPLTPVPSPPPATEPVELKPWSDSKVLHSLKEASEILTPILGSGYSSWQLRRRITNELIPGNSGVWFFDGAYKININNFLEWRKNHPDDRQLKQRS